MEEIHGCSNVQIPSSRGALDCDVFDSFDGDATFDAFTLAIAVVPSAAIPPGEQAEVPVEVRRAAVGEPSARGLLALLPQDSPAPQGEQARVIGVAGPR